MRTFCFILAWLGITSAHAQLVLNEGESFAVHFNSFRWQFVRTNVASPLGKAILVANWPNQTRVLTNVALLEVFESGTNDSAAASIVVTNGILGNWECVASNLWQDLEGTIRVTMLSGTLTIIGFSTSVEKPTTNGLVVHYDRLHLPARTNLTIERIGSGVRVKWPASTNHVLETRGAHSTQWQPATNFVTTDSEWSWIDAEAVDQQFFRLRDDIW